MNKDSINRLETELLGLTLKNPIIVASSSLTDNEKNIRRLLNFGVGAVITKTIYLGKRVLKSGKIMTNNNKGLFNTTMYSKKNITKWLDMLSRLYEEKHPVIPSIYADNPKDLAKLALALQKIGSPALELGISCPNDTNEDTASRIYEYTKKVDSIIEIPIIVKLRGSDNLQRDVLAAKSGGAKAVSISDTLPGVFIDRESSPSLVYECGYSGVPIKPIIQSYILRTRSKISGIQIIGVGGIQNSSDVLEYISIGCSAVQICSAIYINGIGVVPKILDDLYNDVQNMRLTLKDIKVQKARGK
ncbi:dihydroorotate dehydrogenase [Clostridiaceae bacterium M8S5]|nr:dihydroorotate dehydrogenase [Clostridiaceae bacterium M8S5]